MFVRHQAFQREDRTQGRLGASGLLIGLLQNAIRRHAIRRLSGAIRNGSKKDERSWRIWDRSGGAPPSDTHRFRLRSQLCEWGGAASTICR